MGFTPQSRKERRVFKYRKEELINRTVFIKSGIYSTVFAIIFNTAQAQEWKHYPYHQDGSFIYFPEDEGRHSTCETEWWYTIAHLTGVNTGASYSIMLTYFCHSGLPGFRIFNIANESTSEFFPNTSPYYSEIIAEDHLSIQCMTLYGQEKWITKIENDTLVPFQYHLEASSPNGSINLDYDTMKRPLIVGGDGFLPQGDSGETYYYTQTLLAVTGTLTLNDTTEPVTGIAWIDHQYFPVYLASNETYEWFSFQLSNSMDFNVWNLFTEDNKIPEDERFCLVSVYVNDDSQMVSYDFELKRTQFWNAGGGIYYSHGWQFNLGDIHLTIVPSFDDQEVSSPFRFYEGSCTIKGIVDGDSVTGVAFAELLHHYQIPQVEIIHPANGDTLSDSIQVVSWSLLNLDDGNPLLYSLSYSLNDSEFVPITSGIEDTSYMWDVSGLPESNNYRLLLTGYSIDSILVGVDTAKFSITGINESINPISREFELHQNYPNPFTQKTEIRFQMPDARSQKSEVRLTIYDLAGRLVKSFPITQSPNNPIAGIVWDGKNDLGENVGSGIYFYKLKVGDFSQTQKLLLLR